MDKKLDREGCEFGKKVAKKSMATDLKLNVFSEFVKDEILDIKNLILNELAHRITTKYALVIATLISLFTMIIGFLVGFKFF
jgi:hypothetical protein